MTAQTRSTAARSRPHTARKASLLVTGLTLILSSCGSPVVTPTPQTREQDKRTFTAVTPTFEAHLGAALSQGLYDGLQGKAAYAIEVPVNWNGQLIMYTHGYAGTGDKLNVLAPPLRDYWLSLGYAWAASSYSSNYYDVQSGVEDTNALALKFTELTGKTKPTKYLIMGVSMGGHVAGAAVEKETLNTAKNKVTYAAAMPVCGVMDEEYEFQWLGDYTLAAAQLAGYGAQSYPQTDFQKLLPDIKAALFTDTSGPLWQVNSAQGAKLRDLAKQLTGGERPVFNLGFSVGALQSAVLSTGGSDGTLNGILTKNYYGNTGVTYRWTSGDTLTVAEQAFNDAILRVTADADANPARQGALRWLPRVNGEINVPVLTMHTTGDFYVPFKHEQLYSKAVAANANSGRLVQRAIRAAGHCEFVGAELVEGFNDLVKWEAGGAKPAGDDVTTPTVIADPNYGCKFTRETRAGVAPCPVSTTSN
ncbi:alpha/beta hydrolase [Deinococcus humi]|uniref:Pimeloyl-ACP methyl ester carboxylesterase n=1 Tax=Deinococcus humi TaxID=662880 RepID=A0A7W8NDH0_9DEIO|nr:alpha/beta hydrolase [Deinococcus humi]MBB5361605.1 pimeloyl-ACP methyl ester carboxylesterase [Deinococcus humi]GGO20936.1 alpha/beta hydrolase [Deinococcus humi]